MKVLTFFAHPDDETMLCGGTLAFLARSGSQVHYLSATRGEGGERGEPPLCSQEDLGNLRQKELECAIKCLDGTSLKFLDYVDPLVGEENQLFPFTEDINDLVIKLLSYIDILKPAMIITHGSNGEYGHPAHLLCFKAVNEVIQRMGIHSPFVYTVQASFTNHPKPHLANKDDPAHFVLDISNFLDQKIKAALCHKTQHALFIRRLSQKIGRKVTVAETITHLESLHRAFPEVHGIIDDPLSTVLNSSDKIKIITG